MIAFCRNKLCFSPWLTVLPDRRTGLEFGALCWCWQGSSMRVVLAGAAMLLDQLAADFAGGVIPLGLKAIRIDAALASSTFLTTVTDVAGFCSFVGIATLGLK